MKDLTSLTTSTTSFKVMRKIDWADNMEAGINHGNKTVRALGLCSGGLDSMLAGLVLLYLVR